MQEEIRFSFGKGTGGEISGLAKVIGIINHKARYMMDNGDKRFFDEMFEVIKLSFQREPQLIEDWFCINMLDCFNNTDICTLDVHAQEEEEEVDDVFPQNAEYQATTDKKRAATEKRKATALRKKQEKLAVEMSKGLIEKFEVPFDQYKDDIKEAFAEQEFRNAVIDGLAEAEKE